MILSEYLALSLDSTNLPLLFETVEPVGLSSQFTAKFSEIQSYLDYLFIYIIGFDYFSYFQSKDVHKVCINLFLVK